MPNSLLNWHKSMMHLTHGNSQDKFCSLYIFYNMSIILLNESFARDKHMLSWWYTRKGETLLLTCFPRRVMSIWTIGIIGWKLANLVSYEHLLTTILFPVASELVLKPPERMRVNNSRVNSSSLMYKHSINLFTLTM